MVNSPTIRGDFNSLSVDSIYVSTSGGSSRNFSAFGDIFVEPDTGRYKCNEPYLANEALDWFFIFGEVE
jgi:hypothetical protein